MSRLARRGAVAFAIASAAAGAASVWGPVAALALLAAAAALAFAMWFWLPRAAHRAFRAGRTARAARVYRLQRALRVDRRARAQLTVSLAACAVARGDADAALAYLEHADPDHLGEAGRAAWLNNRAYVRGRRGVELERALDDVEEAIALRPDVAGFRHTRGVILLGLGRVQEAIAELDAAWRQRGEGDDAPAEEAERSYDLGVAWAKLGEREYAADYFARARRAAPSSPWARRAAERAPEDSAEPAAWLA